MPDILELGCGLDPHPHATLRHDLRKHAPHVDIAHDLNVTPWPFADAAYDEIIAIDVFEHLSLPVLDWLGECWRILRPGGTLTLRVPVWGTRSHRIDPTHIRGFEPESFDYVVPGTVWWAKYGRYYTDRYWEKGSVAREGDNLVVSLRTVA